MDEEDIQLNALDMADIYKAFINKTPKKKTAPTATTATPTTATKTEEPTIKQEDKEKAPTTPAETKSTPEETTVENPTEEFESPQEEVPIEDVVTEVKVGDYEGVMVTSDSVERQVAEAKKNGREVANGNITDLPDADKANTLGESMEENALNYWAGNAMAEFIINTAKAIRRIFHKKGDKEHDSMNDYYKWLEVTHTNLQNIVDDELPKILESDPDIKVKFIVSKEGDVLNVPDYGPIKLETHVMLALDYEGKVKDIHEKYNNGGIITSNGKQYLLIGNIGYGDWRKADNTQRRQLYNNLFYNKNSKVAKERADFFRKNPSESFYSPEDAYTRIVAGSLLPGYIVHQLEGESAPDYRKLSDVFKDEKRNPHNISFENAIWMIQEREGAFLTNGVNIDKFMMVEDIDKNAGNTFLMVPAGNGRLIPIAMRATRLRDIEKGVLQNEINTLIEAIGNPQSTYQQRLDAVKSLRSRLYFNKDRNWILLDPKHPIVSLKREGEERPFVSFNLERSDYNIEEFKKAMLDMNPRINITLDTISSPDRLRIYDEAGALTTNSAKLGVVGSRYLVYMADETGKPIPVDEDIFSPGGDNLVQYRQPKPDGVVYKGLNYYKQGDKFYLNEVEVKDPNIIRDLEYNYRVLYTPVRHTTQEKGWKYYILTSGENPEVIRIKDKDYVVQVLDEQEAKDYVAKVKKAREEAARRKAAEEELKRQKEEKEKKEREEKSPENMPAEDVIIDPFTGDVIIVDAVTRETKEVMSEDEKKVKQPEEKKEETPEGTQDEIEDTGEPETTDTAPTVSETPATMSFSELIVDPNYSEKVSFAIRKKWPNALLDTSFAELEKFLKEKGVDMDSIGTSDKAIDAWIKTFDTCRD
jgi:hypothetical protein